MKKNHLKTNLLLTNKPKKSYNSEENNDYQKFKSYYLNAIFNQFSSKRKTQYIPFNNKINGEIRNLKKMQDNNRERKSSK